MLTEALTQVGAEAWAIYYCLKRISNPSPVNQVQSSDSQYHHFTGTQSGFILVRFCAVSHSYQSRATWIRLPAITRCDYLLPSLLPFSLACISTLMNIGTIERFIFCRCESMSHPFHRSGHCVHSKLPSWWTHVLVCLLCATLVPNVAALDDEYALGPMRQQSYGGHAQARQGFFIQVCILIGGLAFTVSSSLIGPLTGISSMLWLMMRNDSAIDFRLAWM